MSTSQSGNTNPPATPERKNAGSDPGAEIPTRPEDTTASGEAKNDTGEDNQREKE